MKPGERAKRMVLKKKDTMQKQAINCLKNMTHQEVSQQLNISQTNRGVYIKGYSNLSLEKAMVIVETSKLLSGYDGSTLVKNK